MSTQSSQILRGILAAIGGAMCFSVIDVAFKFLSGGYPLYQVVLVRSLIAMAVLLAVIVPLSGGFHTLRTRHPRLQLFRCLAVFCANLSFFTGLAILPLAEAVAIAFATPLIVTALSALFLGERPGPWRWGAVAAGFTGVLIILRPGPDSFQAAALLPLLGACGYATLHVLTRRAGGADSAAALAFYPTLGFLMISAAAGLITGDGRFATGDSAAADYIFRAWSWPAAQDWPVFLAAGAAASIGGYLTSQAYKLCEAGLAAGFEYAALPMAVFWGVTVFGEWPDAQAWAGTGLIVAAGLVSVWRETRLHRPASRPRPRSTG